MTGIYIGNSIEIISCKNLEICFRRDLQKTFLESILVKNMHGKRKCIGYVKTFRPATKTGEIPDRWIIHFNYDGIEISGSKCNKEKIGQELFKLTSDENNNPICEMYDRSKYKVMLDEIIDENILAPKRLSVATSSIGDSLKSWMLGLNIEKGFERGSKYWEVSINTNKHMYIYHIGEYGVYCRAARYDVSDQGIVFNQNFRQGTYAFMVEDNTISLDSLLVNEDLFNSKSCVIDSDSIYWSVLKVTKDLIYLNGCEGETYEIKKPTT